MQTASKGWVPGYLLLEKSPYFHVCDAHNHTRQFSEDKRIKSLYDSDEPLSRLHDTSDKRKLVQVIEHQNSAGHGVRLNGSDSSNAIKQKTGLRTLGCKVQWLILISSLSESTVT